MKHIKNAILKPLRITAGIILLLIGLVGGLIPIFQGWVFGLLGLWILSIDIPFVRKYYDRTKEWIERKQEERSRTKAQKSEENNKTSGER
jgi:uncharacterized membrane protein YbaN (DUF454 family)